MKKAAKKATPLKSEAELVEYEEYAIEGLCEFIRKGYEEVGIGGLLRSLLEVVHECDVRAAEVQDDADEDMRAPRQAIAEYLRLLAMMSRPEVVGVIEFLAEKESRPPKQKVIGEA